MTYKTGQHSYKIERPFGDVFSGEYWLHIPDSFVSGEKYPLILFLHGAGERGDDLSKVKVHGPPKIADLDPSFPFIVVSPQVPSGQRWDSEYLITLLDEVEAKFPVDVERIYLTGLSMGGYGTWDLASKFPDRFAAIAPICGGGNPELACNLKDTPTWVFHGAQDKVVLIDKSQEMVDAMSECGAEPIFTIYPDAGHDSWTSSYENKELYSWLLLFIGKQTEHICK